jgi:prepilin-type N-terminal cleavage/methylation domain-containing protein
MIKPIDRQAGFTIVELLIVIVVIGILAAITIVGYNGVAQRAHVAVVQSDLSSAGSTLGAANAQNGTFPSDLASAGLKASPGTVFQYVYTSLDNSYCLTATNGTISYTISTSSPTPTSGVCGGSTVSTLAGTGAAGFVDGPGTSAQFSYPDGVTTDSSGNVFVADFNNNSIRKVTPAGIVSTVAGSGTAGYVNGNGASAQFNQPAAVAVDSSGNLYVADYVNNRIRKISPAGVVSTLAGSGTAGYVDGTGASAQFNNPAGVAVDSSGTVYVGDTFNRRIRKITPAGVVSTFAGSGVAGYADGNGTSAQFFSTGHLALDSAGNVYLPDSSNNRIRKITPAGVVTTIAGSGTSGYVDGPAASAQFKYPFGVAVDGAGNVFIADESSNRIRELSAAGVVSTIAGSGTAGFSDGISTGAQFNAPLDIAVNSSGTLFVADYSNHRIRKIQ